MATPEGSLWAPAGGAATSAGATGAARAINPGRNCASDAAITLARMLPRGQLDVVERDPEIGRAGVLAGHLEAERVRAGADAPRPDADLGEADAGGEGVH